MLKRLLLATALALASTASWAGIFQTINVKTITTEPSGTCSNSIFPASTVFMAVDSLKACSCQTGNWVCEAYGASAGAPTTAPYIVQTANGTLTGEQALSALATCLLKNTTTTGVLSCYAGSACGANQYGISTDLVGAWTCAQVNFNQLAGAATDPQIPDDITVNNAATAATGDSATGFFPVGALEVVRGGTGAAPTADDYVFIADSNVAGTWRQINNCTGAGKALTYVAATNTIGCNTIAGAGDVAGPAVATDNCIVRFDGTTGKLVQDCPAGTSLDDAGLLQTATIQTLCTAASGDCVYDSTVNTVEPVAPTANHQNIWPFGGHWYSKNSTSGATEILHLDNEIVSGFFTCLNTGVCTGSAQAVSPSMLNSTAALSGVKFATADSADPTKFIWAVGPSVVIPKHAECFTLYDRTALQTLDDIPSVYRAPAALTVTGVWCEGDEATGTAINLQRDDGSPANVLTANMTCTTTPSTGTIAGAEDNFAAGDRLDLAIITVAGTPAKQLHVCVEYQFD